MSETDQFEKMPILPVYTQTKPNEEIDFGELQIQLEKTGSPVNGKARLKFSPDPRLEFLIPQPNVVRFLGRFFGSEGGFKPTLTFPEYNTEAKSLLCGHDNENEVFRSIRMPVAIRGGEKDDVSIRKLTFHLFNWPDLYGKDSFILCNESSSHKEQRTVGRVFLQADDWMITIVEVETFHKQNNILKSQGGYLITHVGEVTRRDGSAFSADEAREFLSAVQYCFSFAFGRWSGPQLLVGVDATGKHVLEEWGLGQQANGSWRGGISWFDPHHSDFLTQILPGFWRLWKNPIWEKALRESIYWYVAASQLGSGVNVDSALLFTQAALELLSWTYCVLDRKMVSSDAFRARGLRAADKLRILVSTLDIPLEIPPEMTSLNSRQGRKWVDSMDAITDLRNGLVHPGRDQNVPEGAYADAWALSLWYLDMILLRLCGYNGQYSNRLKSRFVGEVETVPWATQ